VLRGKPRLEVAPAAGGPAAAVPAAGAGAGARPLDCEKQVVHRGRPPRLLPLPLPVPLCTARLELLSRLVLPLPLLLLLLLGLSPPLTLALRFGPTVVLCWPSAELVSAARARGAARCRQSSRELLWQWRGKGQGSLRFVGPGLRLRCASRRLGGAPPAARCSARGPHAAVPLPGERPAHPQQRHPL
jgi:hypothetical protein